MISTAFYILLLLPSLFFAFIVLVVIVKHLEAMPNFGSIDVLCSYKTGTFPFLRASHPLRRTASSSHSRAAATSSARTATASTDAPSLHAADVGISVSTGVDVAKDAADIILLESSRPVDGRF